MGPTLSLNGPSDQPGTIQFRLGQLGMQGHVQAADLYLKSLTMGFGTMEPGASVPAGNVTVVQNYLVPRPDYPKLESPTAPPPSLHPDIPTIAVR